MLQGRNEENERKALQIDEILRVTCVTWNLQGSLPSHNSVKQLFYSMIPNEEQSPHIIAISTQECQRSICMSFFCTGKTKWQSMLREVDPTYQLKVSESLQGIHLAILVKRKINKTFNFENNQFLKAGFMKALGNKGAVSVVLNVGGQKLQFISCHLEANHDGYEKRNETLLEIVKTIADEDRRTQIFILGDLNYRINITQNQYQFRYNQRAQKHNQLNTQEVMKYTELLSKDQLTEQKTLKQNFLPFYYQLPISFPPTYKLSKYGPQYKATHIPGWTDRIFNRKGRSKCLKYYCLYNMCETDHRPVIAIYQMNVNHALATHNFVATNHQNACKLI